MKISYEWLEKSLVLYIYFNVIIFVWGLKQAIAIPIIILFFYLFSHKYKIKKDSVENYIIIEKRILLLIGIGITIWLIASGIGGFCKQAGDWHKHNAIIHDLITYDWPVIYELPEGGQGLLSYYIFSYLFPSLIGKIAGFRWAEVALLFQSIVGVFLIYLHLCYFLKAQKRHKQILILILLIFFGGLVLPGKAVYGYFRPVDLTSSFHWFSSTTRIQYSSNIVLMRWVFPQCIVPWLATILFLENPDKIEDFAWIGVPVFMYSCFAFVGLLPLYIGMAVYLLLKKRNFISWIKQIFSLQNIYALLCLFPVFFLYIAGNVFQEKPDVTSFFVIDYSENWILYIVFCISNFLIWSLVVVKKEWKNPVFYISNVVLLILPLFWYGAWNDLCMRASIPALFVIAVLFYKFILDFEIRKKRHYIQFLFCICVICVAALPQTEELYENAKFFSLHGRYRADQWGTLSGQLVRDGSNDVTAYNYVAYDCEKSFFIKYMARSTKDR